MARYESQALAGFYPAPLDLIRDIAHRLFPSHKESLLDPCAGQGEALIALGEVVHAAMPRSSYNGAPELRCYAAELEAERHAALTKALHACGPLGWRAAHLALHGDAFLVEAGARLASILYLNPPYDLDPEHGRLEQRWLQRWLPAVAEGGVLLFLVPFYALGACADTLARGCDEVTCWRFPDEHPDPSARFGLFQQVFLVARRAADTLAPRAAIAAQVRAWGEAGGEIPTIDQAPEVLWSSPECALPHAPQWRLLDLDLAALAHRVQPWASERRRTGRGLVADRHLESAPADGLLGPRRFPVAVPLRPSHLGAALASGVFHGVHLRPDAPAGDLPEVLVKGVFARTWQHQSDKRDKEGKKTGEVQVQTPELRVTVLDLSTGAHHDLKPGVFPTGAGSLAEFTVADLLERYRTDLRQHLTDACPPLHDPARPADAFALPALARPLYPAQADAVRACLRLLGGPHVGLRARRNKAAILLGEVGVGKTPCALAVALACGARRPLVVCPPHLVASWAEQAAVVVPGAHVHVLRDVADLDAWAADPRPGMHLGLLSREGAKLGHRLGGVESGRCPGCGAPLTEPADKLAARRATCEAKPLRAQGLAGRLATDLATALLPLASLDELVVEWAEGRTAAHRASRWAKRTEEQRKASRPEQEAHLRAVAARVSDALLRRLLTGKSVTDEAAGIAATALQHLALMAPVLPDEDDVLSPEQQASDARLSSLIEQLWAWAIAGDSWSERGRVGRDVALRLLALRPRVARGTQVEQLRAKTPVTSILIHKCPWRSAIEDVKMGWFRADNDTEHDTDGAAKRRCWLAIVAPRELTTVSEVAVHARAAFGQLVRIAPRVEGEPCGEPLYGATPDPRRVPLSDRLVRRYRGLVDLLLLDEAHELSTSGAAQEKAAHRLMHLGVPTLLLTGSLMNGYADSLFTHFWSLSPDFRAEFPREASSAFVAAYGYQKRLVEQTDKDKKKVVWGSQSDREQTTRILGDAPGVSPLFVVRYLLRYAVTLHKNDLAVSLPPCTDELVGVPADAELEANYEHLSKQLLETIKKERFTSRGAALWGQLADLPSYLDRATADVGNGTSPTAYEIRWPESLSIGGDLPDPLAGTVVASVPLLPPSTVTAKEQWMLDTVRSELNVGRPCLVFGWHIALLPRLVRLLEQHLGEKVALLRADKVPAAKRQDWINEQVLAPGRRVLVTNPKAVETGLNNLVRFATQVWMQSPACNPVTYRQAVGRVHRIGQKQATRILFPVYQGTSQAALHTLLTQKVAVSLAVDGLDAAGAGDGQEGAGLRHLDVGQALYRLLTGEVRA